MATNEETNAAGTDTRPPMLVENDYESGKIRIHSTFEANPHGKQIGNPSRMEHTLNQWSLDLHMANSTVMPAPRKKLDSEFNDEEIKLEMLILKLKSSSVKVSGSSTKEGRICLWPIGVPKEPHAKKTLKKQEQSTSIVDPLAYVAHTTSAPVLSSPSTPSPQPTAQSPNDALMATMTQIANLLSGFQKQFPPTNNQLRTSSNSRTHATVHDGQIVTEPIQRKALEPKRKMDSQYFKDKALLMEAKEKGDVLDAEAEAFLADVECTAPYDQPQALTTTNMFQANHEDA
ncbi:hypothetical protein Tco_0546827, partial [Tanacetum coccineum]